VLVVEGNRAERATLARALTACGFVVDTAFPGAEALREITSMAYDVVVLDSNAPGGAEVLRYLREQTPQTAVIVVTGSATFGNAVNALRAGVADYILKPTAPETVIAALRRWEACQLRVRPRQQLLEQACRAVRPFLPLAPTRRAASVGEHVVVPPLSLDPATGVLTATVGNPGGERRVHLSGTEAQLLARLMAVPGDVCSCSRLAEVLRPGTVEALADRSWIRPIIVRLRDKMRRLGLPADVIATVRGRGYRLDPGRLSDRATHVGLRPASAKLPARHILVADGDWLSCQSLGRALRAAGHAVNMVGRGDEALAQLEVLGYDLLIADPSRLSMPGATWLSAVRALRPHLPLVVLSARPTWEEATAVLSASADGYLTKPISADELLGHIERAVRRRAVCQRYADLAAAVVATVRAACPIEPSIAGRAAAASTQLTLPLRQRNTSNQVQTIMPPDAP
jgi:DNA-binding response OmpR family regulator